MQRSKSIYNLPHECPTSKKQSKKSSLDDFIDSLSKFKPDGTQLNANNHQLSKKIGTRLNLEKTPSFLDHKELLSKF